MNALLECVAARRLIRCRVARPWLRGLQCTHVRIRWHPTNGLEHELWLRHLWHDVCVTNPARPAPTPSSSMLSDAKSRPGPHGLHPCSRLGRRTPRSGTLPVHDLHRMGREACCRHDMAYPVSWRRVTHLQRSLRWGSASQFESSRLAILNDKSLRNRVYVRFRRLFRFSHRTCDPSSKWAVRGTAKLRQTAGKPGHAHARRVARSADHLERRLTGGHLGRAVGPGRDCAIA